MSASVISNSSPSSVPSRTALTAECAINANTNKIYTSLNMPTISTSLKISTNTAAPSNLFPNYKKVSKIVKTLSIIINPSIMNKREY